MSKPEEMPLNTTEPRPRITAPERRISITPLDMRQARFTTAMRGFDKADVTTFLLEAADGFDQAMRENERLRMDIVRLEASLEQYRALESTLNTTLMTAQKVADDMRDGAQKEAQRIIRDAEAEAELMTRKAQSRTEDIEREIDGLRIKRREAETTLEATIAALHNTLDFIREQENSEREDRIVQHRPRFSQIAAANVR